MHLVHFHTKLFPISITPAPGYKCLQVWSAALTLYSSVTTQLLIIQSLFLVFLSSLSLSSLSLSLSFSLPPSLIHSITLSLSLLLFHLPSPNCLVSYWCVSSTVCSVSLCRPLFLFFFALFIFHPFSLPSLFIYISPPSPVFLQCLLYVSDVKGWQGRPAHSGVFTVIHTAGVSVCLLSGRHC